MIYAGFWRRFGAAFADGIILWIGLYVVGFALSLVGTDIFHSVDYGSAEFGVADGLPVGLVSTGFALNDVGLLVLIAMNWFYSAILESSARGATLGKMALGLRVTDVAGKRIGFGRASGRFFAKFLSALILMIGFIMAGFTARKQALHDMLAGCLVIAKSA